MGDRRKPNTLLTEARLHLLSPSGSGQPMSRQELAEAVNAWQWDTYQVVDRLDEHDIGKLERGEIRWPRQQRRDAFRAVLGAKTDADIGFYRNRRPRYDVREPVLRAENDLEDHHPGKPVVVQADVEWAGMLRRAVIKAPALFAAVDLLRAATPRDSGDALDLALVRGLLTVAGHYRQAYHAVPASRLVPAALAHLDLVMSLRPASRPAAQRVPLVTAAGEMATLVGVLLGLDAARHEAALSYFNMAWEAARSIRDVELQTVVLGCRSFALAYGGGDHRTGLECADLAREIGTSGASPQTRAWVAAVASERCASLGDLSGCQRRLDESRSALASPNDESVVWRGIGGYNDDKLRAYEGGNMMRLGRYRHAEELLNDALNRLDVGMSRHRATALLDRAEARLGLGDIDAACLDAARSLTLVTHVQHTGHLDRISALAARGAAAGSSAARTLHTEVQLTRLDYGLPTRKATR